MSILAFAGSARRGSFNARLLSVAVGAARDAGAVVTEVDLRDYPMPIFDEDLEREQGMPDAVRRLRTLALEHRGLLLACPEYNSSITPLLKNVIDWLSRGQPGEGPLAVFDGKVAGLLAASPGALGGLRGLFHVREILQNIRVTVLPDPMMIAVPKAHEAFADDGTLKDDALRGRIDVMARKLAELVG